CMRAAVARPMRSSMLVTKPTSGWRASTSCTSVDPQRPVPRTKPYRCSDIPVLLQVVFLDVLNGRDGGGVKALPPRFVAVRERHAREPIAPGHGGVETGEDGHAAEGCPRITDQLLIADRQALALGHATQAVLGGMELLDPRPGAQLPGVPALGLPLSRRHPRPPHDALGPPVDVGERQGDRPSVADDLDEARIGEGLEQEWDAAVVGDPLVDKGGAPIGTPDGRERPTQPVEIGTILRVLADTRAGVERLPLDRHRKGTLPQRTPAPVDVRVVAAAEPGKHATFREESRNPVEHGQLWHAGGAAHPVGNVRRLGVQTQRLVHEAGARPRRPDEEDVHAYPRARRVEPARTASRARNRGSTSRRWAPTLDR